MKNALGLCLILTAICSAQGTDNSNAVTRMSPEEISGRIRERLEARGIRIEDVTRAVQEQRGKTRSARHTVTPQAMQPSALSQRDQATVSRIVDVFNRVYNVYVQLGVLTSPPDLYYNTSPTINAYAAKGSQVVIYLALAELLQDSDSELSMAVAHELGHIVQQRENALYFVYDNPEFDADVWGVLISLLAGYDPYAGAGTLAKLSMATGDVGLAQQFEDQSASDAHKSFVTRIEVMYNALRAVCGVNADFQNTCDQYRSAVHPHFPTGAVL
jgi:hypothetical protein